MTEVILTAPEMATFNRLLPDMTKGRVLVGLELISHRQARALWAATRAFSPVLGGVPTQRAPSHRWRELHRMSAVVAMSAAAALSGCAAFGGNIKGDFACRAPDGICAPTSKIDDQALAMISGGNPETAPAGGIDPGDAPDRRLIPVGVSAAPARTSEKVLRIVFPAHVDRAGRFREASAIHAVVERGSWLAAYAEGPLMTTNHDPDRRQQLAMVAPGPTLAELAAHSPEVGFPDPLGPDPLGTQSAGLTSETAARANNQNVPPAAADAAVRRKGNLMRIGTRDKRIAAVQVQVGSRAPAQSAAVVAHSARAAERLASTGRTSVTAPSALGSSPTGAPVAAMPSKAAAMADVSTASFDLRSAGSASPLQAIRNQVGSILARRKPSPVPTKQAPTEALADRPVNGPTVLPVSGVDQ